MKKNKTAEEVMRELRADSDFLMREQQRAAAIERLEAELRNAEEPLIKSLRMAGVNVGSVWDLIGWGQDYSNAIPVLFNHLKKNYPVKIREGILRALATPYSRKRWGDLMGIFEKNTANLSPDIRYVAAFALGEVVDDSVLDDVIRLIGDKRLGGDRVGLLPALVKSKSSRAKMTLLELRGDPDLGKEIKKMRRLDRYLKAEK